MDKKWYTHTVKIPFSLKKKLTHAVYTDEPLRHYGGISWSQKDTHSKYMR